ncbi:hypothetical protein G5I_05340 [Acromyrmex echinatior]|uniref:Uncharacterized protein n=1 Tax=Acromyrmex echinatior TaxID=103372 RepID=F4WHZ3_ACREC|nr:hypothetical protein G5I_05340 [Acromyrmex echinatior]
MTCGRDSFNFVSKLSVPGAFQEIAARCWVNVIALYRTVMKAPDCQPPANAEHLLFSGCAPIQTEWKKESHRISTGTTVDHRSSFHRKCKHAGVGCCFLTGLRMKAPLMSPHILHGLSDGEIKMIANPSTVNI